MISARGEGWRLEIGVPATDEEYGGRESGAEIAVIDRREQKTRSEVELVYGEYETINVPVDDLVRLPQVRSGLNPDLPDLKESIKTNGLLNPVDIAIMDEEAFRHYIEFNNSVWGRDVSFEDYEYLRQPDGTFKLLVAGHTRVEAISQLQVEDDENRCFAVVCKVHHATDPHSIISLQLDENIHSKPSPERRAMALVEAWLYGAEKGLWKSKAEFLRTDGKKFNAKNLNDAIAFSRLPSDVRDFVFEGNISYGASVELGKSVDTVRDYVKWGMGIAESDNGDEAVVDEAYRMKIGAVIQHVFSRNLGVGASATYIKGQVEMMRVALGQAKSQPEIPLFSPAEQLSMGYEKIKKEFLDAVRETNSLAREKRERQLRLQRQLTKAAELSLILEQVSSERQGEGMAA